MNFISTLIKKKLLHYVLKMINNLSEFPKYCISCNKSPSKKFISIELFNTLTYH